MEDLKSKLKLAEKYNQNYSINEIIKILEQKDKRIAKLEQELAELKEKAIVPNYYTTFKLLYKGRRLNPRPFYG